MERLAQVVRKDFRDSIRERQLYFLGGLFLLVGGFLGYIVGQSSNVSGWTLPRFGLMALLFLGPLGAMVLSYNGIVGKRVTGELRVLLSLPFSREDVFFGTFLGRVGVMAAASTATLLFATLLALALGSAVSLSLLIAALVITVVAMTVFVSLAVGISASTTTTTRAAALAFGSFFVFIFRLWELVPLIVRFAINGLSIPRGDPPEWAVLWGELSPLAALQNAVAGPTPRLADGFAGFVPSATGEAVYFQPWFGALIVAVWIAGPLALGLLRFRGADL